jgi:hypothetical protein
MHGRPASLGEPVVSITPAVAGLYAVPVSVSQMNLYWTLNASNATSIEVARSDDGGAYATLAASAGGSATMFTDTTVSEGHSYSYEIRAVQPIGDSAYSDPAVATTLAVQGLYATAASTTEIDLSWLNLSSDPAATVDVQRAPFGTSDFTTIAAGLPAGTSGYSDLTGLSEGTHWTYQVLLHEPGMGNLATLSDPADTWTLPAAPTTLAVTSTASGEVDLAWLNVSAGADEVQVWRADSGGVFQLIDTLDPAATSYADTSVSDGTQYTYRIVASVNGESSVVTDASPLTTPQAAPSDLTAVTAPGSSNEIDVSWTNNSQSASAFHLERSTGGGAFDSPRSISSDTNTFQDTSVQPGTQYTYRVLAFGPGGPSAWSATGSATTLPTVSVSGAANVAEQSSYTLTPTVNYDSNHLPFPVTGWSVNWGDGVTDSLSGPGPFPHTFAEAGHYTVAATAQTAGGAVDASTAVTVGEAPATLSLGPVDPVDAGASFTLPLTLINPGLETITGYVVNWGDGQFVRSTDSSLPTLTHAYPHGRTTFAVGVTVFTDESAYHAATAVDVNDAPQSFSPLSLGVSGGQAWLFACPSPGISPGAGYTLDWGDGGPQSSGTLDANYSATASHDYAEEGQYWVMAAVGSINRGAWTSVSDPAGSAASMDAIPDQTLAAGQPADVSASFSGLDDDGPTNAYVDWGDGTGPHPAAITGGGSGAGSATAHLDHAPNTGQTGTLIVYDEDGTSVSSTFAIQPYGVTLSVGGVSSVTPQPSATPTAFIPLDDGYDAGGSVPDNQLSLPPSSDDRLVDASVSLYGPGDMTATWHLDFPSSVHVFQAQEDGSLTPLTSGTDYGPVNIAGTSIPLMVQGISTDNAVILTAVCTPTSSSSAATKPSSGTVAASVKSLLNPEAVIDNVGCAELAGADKQMGIYLPISDQTRDPVTKKTPAPLLAPVVLHDVTDDAHEMMKLVFGSNIEIFSDAAGKNQVISGRPLAIPADATTYYVEATANGQGTIKLQYADNAPAAAVLDSFPYTAFQWKGPKDVPQYGKYEYKVSFSSGAKAPAGAQWVAPAPEDGTMSDHAVKGKPDKSDQDIQWGAGPNATNAVYQATTNYVWDMAVNVVQVKVETPAAAFTPNDVADGKVNQQGNSKSVITGFGGKAGFSWKAKVTLTGPNNGSGVEHIVAGFVQNLTVTQFRGSYGNPVQSTLAAMDNSAPNHPTAMEGRTYFDAFAWGRQNDANTPPSFYINTPAAVLRGRDGKTAVIMANDSPSGGPPLVAVLQLVEMKLDFNYSTYVVAATDEAINVNAAQAMIKWEVNGDGSIDPSNAQLYTWTRAPEAGVKPPQGPWTLPTNGQLLPQPLAFKDTPSFNDVADPATLRWKKI